MEATKRAAIKREEEERESEGWEGNELEQTRQRKVVIMLLR